MWWVVTCKARRKAGFRRSRVDRKADDGEYLYPRWNPSKRLCVPGDDVCNRSSFGCGRRRRFVIATSPHLSRRPWSRFVRIADSADTVFEACNIHLETTFSRALLSCPATIAPRPLASVWGGPWGVGRYVARLKALPPRLSNSPTFALVSPPGPLSFPSIVLSRLLCSDQSSERFISRLVIAKSQSYAQLNIYPLPTDTAHYNDCQRTAKVEGIQPARD